MGGETQEEADRRLSEYKKFEDLRGTIKKLEQVSP